jgi:hypothetical protein
VYSFKSILNRYFKNYLIRLYLIFKFIHILSLQNIVLKTKQKFKIIQYNPFISLCLNIYLNEFDWYIENLKQKINKIVLINSYTNWFNSMWITTSKLLKTEKIKTNIRKKIYQKKVKESYQTGIFKKSLYTIFM